MSSTANSLLLSLVATWLSLVAIIGAQSTRMPFIPLSVAHPIVLFRGTFVYKYCNANVSVKVLFANICARVGV